MLDFLPGRIGHACCFGEEEWIKLKSSKIPVRYLTSSVPFCIMLHVHSNIFLVLATKDAMEKALAHFL